MNILLVDDHPLFRSGLTYLLRTLDEHLEIEEAGDCAEAVARATEGSFDLVLLDLKMPGTDGLEALAALRNAFPSSLLVVLSGEDDPRTVRNAIESGAMGYIPKSSTPEVMVQALKLVLANGTYLPPRVLAAASSKNDDRVTISSSANSKIEGLSPRQMDVFRCVVRGKSNKVIARELNISEGTVKAHLSSVMRALGASNRTEAVYAAAKLGVRLV